MTSSPSDDEREEIEIDLLLEALHRRYGQDFRDYSRSSLRRRILKTVLDEGLSSISSLQDRVLHDESCLDRVIRSLSINVTSMFRDPHTYLALRTKVMPRLRTYPSLRIWHAGCSSGEEVYSMAILLHEEGLLARSRIHATDMSEALLRVARKGVYPMSEMREYTSNYQKTGGTAVFSDYYTARYDQAILRRFLRERVTFSQHHLGVDGPFNDFHVVMCRNVTIYFNERLQARVHDLVFRSLVPFGILVLGGKETLDFTPHVGDYEAVSAKDRVYRRLR